MSGTDAVIIKPPDAPEHDPKHPLFIFCHGFGGNGTNCWFSYAHTTCIEHDCNFASPDCPSPFNPKYPEWKETILREINRCWNKTQPIIFVGHSLGCYTLFKILSESANESWMKSVKGFLSVAPVVSPKLLPHQVSTFTDEIDWQNVTKLPIIFRHVYCSIDAALGSKHSIYLEKLMTEANANYKCTIYPNTKIDTHYGGFMHYNCPVLNDAIISLLHEVDPGIY